MKLIGRIAEIWRYPVSSLAGERVASASLTMDGVVDDRQFGLIDGETGLPAAPEKHARWRTALHLQAHSIAGQLPTITFPDGLCRPVDDRALNGLLSDYFGFDAVLAAHEAIDGYTDFPRTGQRHPHFPVHVLTTASLRRLAEVRQTDAIDVRRFRPTVLIETVQATGFVEKNWIGQSLRLGAVGLRAEEETTRCGITFIAQPGVEDDPEVLRSILRHNKRHLGINCTVDVTGTLNEGDDVFIDDTPDQALSSAPAPAR
ncbi:MOSC domain-containing protein [Tardiphaga sp. vice352]|uniref:MOSC domain-containing protein n=1 Tax=unclassified Tardiphaga TaxID=2631404 RepID=UPI0011630FBE|nr:MULTISPECIES: MOSC N-terminal beta barrel domain-containing protein [unclassified Tardiphaga]QDM17292.1 MOSC domain-containing protein [Tardiphaga sp. vice278]QDM22266.1 MOSC domain-containing protein [Tardiphaga sp. vice154]QDM27528.1 MOSC domain-containing protein [Tardiphaga sp. vice304]QDM32666.1 MOSC domain-containing protein [Tardiphaga sp. vice352]